MTMDHERFRELINPYVDGELDLLTARETSNICAVARIVVVLNKRSRLARNVGE